ncbi:MAG: TolC family protein [Rugosibacter sp.]|nr:MAG: TolC family protein [Rugosibacter sp.]TBR08660.1 MAG: TolC family protein [Rugosibacter sp.]
MNPHIVSPGSPRTIITFALSAVLLGGCATFSNDGGFETVTQVTQDRTGKAVKTIRSDDDAASVQSSIKTLLARPLDAGDAVQIALLNNRGLQATYAELGIAEADLVQAGRLHNPGFTFGRTRQGDDVLIARTFTLNLINLITAPLAQRIEGRRFEQVQLLVANEALRVATETRRAYFEAIAAKQGIVYAKQVSLAAESGADLAHQMGRTGNWSALEQAREQAFYAEATASVARATKASVMAREKLTRLMGLWGDDIKFQLPDRLPALPVQPLELDNAESFALQNRLDVQAGKLETDGLAASLGLTKATRFVNVLDLGYIRNNQTGLPQERGYELSIEIPLFDWGGARVTKAEAIYMQSVNRLAEAAVNARSEVRESYLGYRTSYDLARHYRDNIVPLRKKISDENLLRYNGMLIGVFELLADAREQVASVNGYIDALKDYWIAETDLQAALGGKLPNNNSMKGP